MSTTDTTTTPPTQADVRSGWTTFAGIMLAIAGVANGLWAWAALRDAAAWGDYRPIADAAFVGPLEFWGWIALGWAVIVIIGAVLLLKNHSSGRIMGITVASISAVFWLLAFPTFPLLALAILAIDVLIIYGLAVHGEKSHA
jgi:hypothetical protein